MSRTVLGLEYVDTLPHYFDSPHDTRQVKRGYIPLIAFTRTYNYS